MSVIYAGIVHVEGDEGDVLFHLPQPVPMLGEGSTITYSSTAYKVETVNLRVEPMQPNPNPNNETLEDIQPVVYFGVSVV